MMAKRLKLHEELLSFVNHAYFQPPENIKLEYPCIVYSRASGYETHADNRFYVGTRQYDLTLIERNPDSTVGEEIRLYFPMCTITNYYTADNLYHTKLNLYY